MPGTQLRNGLSVAVRSLVQLSPRRVPQTSGWISPAFSAPRRVSNRVRPLIGLTTVWRAVLLPEGTDATAVGLRAISGRDTVPQVFVDGEHIGGSEETQAYFQGIMSKAA